MVSSISRALELIQYLESAASPFAFDWIARVRQGLQLAEDEARHNQRPAEKPRRAKIGDATVDDHIRVNNQRLALRRLPRETDVRNDEREFVAAAAHRQHHAEISKGAINNQPQGPLRRFALVTENLRGHEQIREQQAEKQTESGGRKKAQ